MWSVSWSLWFIKWFNFLLSIFCGAFFFQESSRSEFVEGNRNVAWLKFLSACISLFQFRCRMPNALEQFFSRQSGKALHNMILCCSIWEIWYTVIHDLRAIAISLSPDVRSQSQQRITISVLAASSNESIWRIYFCSFCSCQEQYLYLSQHKHTLEEWFQ